MLLHRRFLFSIKSTAGFHHVNSEPRGDVGGVQDVPRAWPEEEEFLPRGGIFLQKAARQGAAQAARHPAPGLHGGCQEQEHLRQARHQAPVGQGAHDQPQLEGEERQVRSSSSTCPPPPCVSLGLIQNFQATLGNTLWLLSQGTTRPTPAPPSSSTQTNRKRRPSAKFPELAKCRRFTELTT